MELTYSDQASDFEPGRRYRNPRYFDVCEYGATSVVIIGNWPHVADAYRKAGVPVKEIGVELPAPDPALGESGFIAVRRGRGSYSVMSNGVEVVEGLTRLEYQAFNTYSSAEKSAFVAARAGR